MTALKAPFGLWNEPAPQPAIAPLERLEDAKAMWKSTGIADYVVTVVAFRGLLHAESHTITVKAGKPVSDQTRCESAMLEIGGCVVEAVPPERYSVDGLLAQAEATMRDRGENAAQMKYDPVLGLPLDATFDEPSAGGSRGFWIEKFERTPAARG